MNTSWRTVAAVLILGLGGSVQAQTCTPNAGSLNDSTGTLTINTCLSTNQLLSACNGLDAIGASPDTIYSVQIGNGAAGAVSAAPTGYDLKLALLQGTCSAGSTCIRDADSNGIGGAEVFSVSGLPVGLYFVLLTSFGGSPDCGSTAITIQPLMPVTLQGFSID